ncbi:MAG TPA: autorepressor SdpR family transcription factor [Fulvivirga sp.]|nr:autorepressor SdpR family transcription factor [Fulvivirga sp.]
MNVIFKAIGDQTRRSILQILKEKDLNAGEIADQFKMTKPSISHHLEVLKRADLVTSRKEGQYVIYSINTSVIDDLFRWIAELKVNIHEEKTNTRNSVLGIDNTSNPAFK